MPASVNQLVEAGGKSIKKSKPTLRPNAEPATGNNVLPLVVGSMPTTPLGAGSALVVAGSAPLPSVVSGSTSPDARSSGSASP